MAYPTKLLNQNESVVLDLRPHWFFFFGPVFSAALTVVVMFLLAAIVPSGGFRNFLFWVGLAALVGFFCWTAWRFVGWRNTNFVVTSQRLVYRSGVFAKSGIQIPLDRINNVMFNQNLVHRLIGTGNLVIESAGESGRQQFTNVKHPDSVVGVINAEVERNEHAKYETMGKMTGGGGGHPDVGGQLEKLEGLLQRGTISQAEFDAQKAKLLGGS
jgi:membrane protein YdbS with pleckstrin-like domain